MTFDALTLAAVRDELEPLLTHGRVQKVVFPDELSLALEIFTPGAGRTAVLLSAHPELGRIQRISQLPARGLERDTPFSLLARKHLRNARIHSVRQPRLERVLELDCEQRDDIGQANRTLLIVEAMGRRSNLVLVGPDGAILDALRRSPPSRNPRRPVLPHYRYAPPPPQDRLLPEQLSAEALASRARGRSGSLAGFLSDTLAGLSPLAGRELAFRLTDAVDTPLGGLDWAAVVEGARAFLAPIETHAWQPTLAVRDGRPIAFAAYRLDHLAAAGAELRSFGSISAALDAFYSQQPEAQPGRARGDPLAAERRTLLAALERAGSSIARRITALEQQLESSQQQREPLRRAGELILAHQTEVEPGASELVVDSERIELDGQLSAIENAQSYFARYRKMREAAERVPALLDEARQQAEHVDQLRTLVELADSMDAIRALRQEVESVTGRSRQPQTPPGGRARPRPAGATRAAPHRRIALGDGWEALVGASAAGNAAVTFEQAQADDLWLHARGVPGAHVILRSRGAPGAQPPSAVLERAAELAAWHSAARTGGRVEVDVAPRRYVRKIPNAPPGLVRYSHERTLRVEAKP